MVAPNRLQRQFAVAVPNRAWVTDVTGLRTHEGWLYLAVDLDLFSRQVIGWSMGSRIDRALVLNALLMAVWRRQPRQEVLLHLDQGSQFSSHDWQDFVLQQYNPKRRHGSSGRLSPVLYEQRYLERLESV